MNNDNQVYAYDFEGERYDVGEKLGFVKTTIEYALKDDSMREELTRFIKELGYNIKSMILNKIGTRNGELN